MNKDFFKDERGRLYVAVSKDFTKKKARTIANEQFKIRKDLLHVQSGVIKGDVLTVHVGNFGDVWVISRKRG